MSKRKPKVEPWHVRASRKEQKNLIPIRKRYLICTEGKTEALYFQNYRSTTGPLVIPLDKSDHKVSLVKKTIEEKQLQIDRGEYDELIDETWVILDRDADPRNSYDKMHFNQALELAKKSNIQVGYSNDSFELWYVLHFQDLQTPMHRNQLNQLLSEKLGEKYKKQDIYKLILPNREVAIKRAKKLLKIKCSPESDNPSTSVHSLIEKLLNDPSFREQK